jgi:hypothetical protein
LEGRSNTRRLVSRDLNLPERKISMTTIDSSDAHDIGFELADAYPGPGQNPIGCSLGELRSRIRDMGYECDDNRVLEEIKDAWMAAWRRANRDAD